MKRLNSVFALALCLALSGVAVAEEKYPQRLPNRLVGRDQMRVGSCKAEAETDALEQRFANANWSVTLSPFYRHAKNWLTQDYKSLPSTYLKYSEADKAVLNANGGILPGYMWPEDGALIKDTANIGEFRPSVSEQAVIDPAYASPVADGHGLTSLTFQQGFRNSTSVQALKDQVKAGAAVDLGIQAEILYYFDHVTGLMNEPYLTIRDSVLKEKISHAVSVVGFDDALGAFIIRNSWVDRKKLLAIATADTEKLKPELDRMMNKIAPYPVAGYYALPYDYVNDLATLQRGGFDIQTLNESEFLRRYYEFKKFYTVMTVPYSCERKEIIKLLDTYQALKGVVADPTSTPARIKQARKQIYSILQSQVALNSRKFSFAKLAYNSRMPNVDRVAEFYSGKFHDYYCRNTPRENFFPQPADFSTVFNALTDVPWFLKLSISQTQAFTWDEVFSWMNRDRRFPKEEE